MATVWYYQDQGTIVGPVTPRELRQAGQRGRIGPETPVRRGTTGQWVRAARVKGLFGGVPPLPPNRKAMGPPPPPPVQSPARGRPTLATLCVVAFVASMATALTFTGVIAVSRGLVTPEPRQNEAAKGPMTERASTSERGDGTSVKRTERSLAPSEDRPVPAEKERTDRTPREQLARDAERRRAVAERARQAQDDRQRREQAEQDRQRREKRNALEARLAQLQVSERTCEVQLARLESQLITDRFRADRAARGYGTLVSVLTLQRTQADLAAEEMKLRRIREAIVQVRNELTRL